MFGFFKGKKPKARTLNCIFSQEILPQFMSEDAIPKLQKLSASDGEELLATLWGTVYNHFSQSGEVAGPKGTEGISVSCLKDYGHFFVVLEYPQPILHGDAFCSVLLASPRKGAEPTWEGLDGGMIRILNLVSREGINDVLGHSAEKGVKVGELAATGTPDFVQWVIGHIIFKGQANFVVGEKPEYAEARRKAMETFPVAFNVYAGRELEYFAIKVEVNREHIWVNQIALEGDDIYSGAMDVDSLQDSSLKASSQIQFTKSQISDWVLVCDGWVYGNYTMKATLHEYSAENRAKIEAKMAPEGVDALNALIA